MGDAGTTSPRVWVVRAGQAAAYADLFRTEGCVAIGFLIDQSVAGLSPDQLLKLVRSLRPDEPGSVSGQWAGALFRFASDLSPGDYVLTPEPGGTLLVGEISGPYEFRRPSPIGQHFHFRTVRWFARLNRQSLSEGAQGSLGSIMTLFLPGYQKELMALITPFALDALPGPRPYVDAAKGAAVAGSASVAIPDNPPNPPEPISSQFEADKRYLMYLLDLIRNRDLALPDFQRSFVWEPEATRELIVSIVRGFPAGSLLLLRGGSKAFLPRAVEEAPTLDGHQPSMLVLDGQQRLSSLYQAFGGVGAHRFFVDFAALMHGEEIDAAVKVFNSRKAAIWMLQEAQARSLMFPLSRIRDFSDWRDEILDARSDDDASKKRLRGYFNRMEDAVITPIKSYQFPVTTLSEQTPTEAVCTIFETLNRTGIKLSVFELICARAFADGHRLRERWRQSLDQHAVLGDFQVDPYYILQAVALRTHRKPQRGIVADMPVATIVDEWDRAVSGMSDALVMLRDECGVLTAKWLPYAPMLPTIAAAWMDVAHAQGAVSGARRQKLQRWFWCSSFLGDYDSSPNSRAEADVPRLHDWLNGGDPPRAVSDFNFDARSLLDVTVRQRGQYRATMALLMRKHPLDFHSTVPLTRTVIENSSVDDHHIFPAAYLREHDAGYVDTVLNHTLIDKLTNIRIGKKAPSVYLAEIEKQFPAALERVLETHGLPPQKDGPLWTDDYPGFLDWRLGYVERELTGVTA